MTVTAGGRLAWPRWWPAVLAWALFALVLAVFATYPWFDRLARDAGRADLALLAPFAIPPTLAANTVGAVLASPGPVTRWAGCYSRSA
jgi:hypothetical protein